MQQGRLLDVGCAFGLLVQEALRQGFDAYGLDISEDAVGRARQRLGARCQVGNVETEFPFDGTFDVFTLNSTLEHFRDPRRVIEALASKASPHGWLFIKTMNRDSLTRALLEEDWEGYWDYTHYSVDLMTPQNLRQWCAETGWKVEEIYTQTGPYVRNLDPFEARWGAMGEIPGFRDVVNSRLKGDFLYLAARRSGA